MPISLLAIARAAAATAGATANGDATILVAKPTLFPRVLVESRTVLGPHNTPFNNAPAHQMGEFLWGVYNNVRPCAEFRRGAQNWLSR
jgi:hypothetical protein